MRTFQNQQRLSVLIVGLGAVGTAFAKALSRLPRMELILVGRSRPRDRRLARELGLPLLTRIEAVEDQPQIIILAVRDDQIKNVTREFAKYPIMLRNAVFLHTSGAIGVEPLKSLAVRGAAVAAFHPYQTFPISRRDVSFQGVTFGIDGNRRGLRTAERLARLLGGKPVRVSGPDRALYHASAVLACGLVGANLDMAVTLLKRCGLSENQALDAALHIAEETLRNSRELGVKEALTGPALRGDLATIRKHLAALKTVSPEIARAYRTVSTYLAQSHKSRSKGKSQ